MKFSKNLIIFLKITTNLFSALPLLAAAFFGYFYLILSPIYSIPLIIYIFLYIYCLRLINKIDKESDKKRKVYFTVIIFFNILSLLFSIMIYPYYKKATNISEIGVDNQNDIKELKILSKLEKGSPFYKKIYELIEGKEGQKEWIVESIVCKKDKPHETLYIINDINENNKIVESYWFNRVGSSIGSISGDFSRPEDMKIHYFNEDYYLSDYNCEEFVSYSNK